MKKTVLVALCVFTSLYSNAQDSLAKHIASVTASMGVLTFNGSIGKGKDVSKYTYIRGGYGLNIEKRFMNDYVGASLNLVTGKLAMAERSTDTSHNKNFESSLMQVGLNITGYLQNRKGIPLVPYATVGFAYGMLNGKTDLKYSGDSLYYYWDDGSIRDQSQIPANEFSARHVNRDYLYESPLKGAATSAMSVPVGAGFKMKVGEKLEVNLGATYHIAFTDNIDGVKDGVNEKYLYSYWSITYNIMKKSKEEKEREKQASNVDFASLDKQDSDGDAIKDKDDLCPGTPKGAKVDGKGCPLDEDDDGVPDYIDQEKGTRKGSIVDTDGKTITDAMILEKARKDSVAAGRFGTFMSAPSTASLKQLDTEIQKKSQDTESSQAKSSSKVPAHLQNADVNKDGIISSSEITLVIDGFFDGTNDYTVEKIHALIDFFFEQ